MGENRLKLNRESLCWIRYNHHNTRFGVSAIGEPLQRLQFEYETIDVAVQELKSV